MSFFPKNIYAARTIAQSRESKTNKGKMDTMCLSTQTTTHGAKKAPVNLYMKRKNRKRQSNT